MEQIENKSETDNIQFAHMERFLSVLPSNIRRIDSLTIRGDRPLRCRALFFSNDGQQIALIGRKRNGISYAVLPGGGVEDDDSDAISTVHRELQEELSVRQDDIVVYDNEALEIEPGVWVFLVKAKHPNIILQLGDGPEQEINGKTERGHYFPGWSSSGG
jgi:8-oxo-dGTP pyrophosphatase MutT (NUDIX family)